MDPTPRRDVDPTRMAEKAMSWHGWGSPVGLGLFLVAIGLFLYLLHLAAIW